MLLLIAEEIGEYSPQAVGRNLMRLIHVCYILVALAVGILFLDVAFMLVNVGAFANTVPGQVFTPVAVSLEIIKGLLWLSGGLTLLAAVVAYFAWNPSMPKSAFGKPVVTRR